MADIMNVNEDHIPRQVRGNNTTMKGISHQPSKKNDAINGRPFYLARAVLDPPTNLCKKLFSASDECHDQLVVKEFSPDNNNPIQRTIS
jgi:hypothetical protein